MGRVTIYPLTSSRWSDLARLFGPRGAVEGCWCMWPRLVAGEYRRRRGAPNRRAFRRLVESGPPPGVLAYVDGAPAGWCAIAPRHALPRLERSRVMKPVDNKPVWSVTCFFIGRDHRGRGLTVRLLRAAMNLAAAHGARLVEGYPTDPRGKRPAAAFVWTGISPTFARAGFREVARRSPTRPIMRRAVRGGARGG